MALQAIVGKPSVYKVILEQRPEGVYVLVDSPTASNPCEDHLQNDWEMAKRAARYDYGIQDDQWVSIPDMGFNS